MRKDFVLIPDDQPGVIARLGEAAGAAGINIEGISAFTGQGKGVVHVLVPDAELALKALSEAGLDVRAARDVIVLDVPNEPGALGRVARRLADENINVEQAYIANNNRLVLAVDDIDRARELLQ